MYLTLLSSACQCPALPTLDHNPSSPSSPSSPLCPQTATMGALSGSKELLAGARMHVLHALVFSVVYNCTRATPKPVFLPFVLQPIEAERRRDVCHSVPPSALMRSHTARSGKLGSTARQGLRWPSQPTGSWSRWQETGTRLGHSGSAGAGWKRVGSEVPAEHLAQALGQELGKSWFRQMPAQCLCLE